MGIKTRSSRKVFPGVRVNRNGNSTSYTVGGKYHRTTINEKTGRITETTRIPGTHVSFTTTSHASESQRTASPLTYKVCGVIMLALGILAAFIGLVSFPVGGWMFVLISLLPLYYGWKFLQRSKQNRNGE